jgi:S-adenosylhomocysteine hydrolase
MLDDGRNMHRLGKVETYKQKTHDEAPVAEETTCSRRDCWAMTLEALLTFVMINIDEIYVSSF